MPTGKTLFITGATAGIGRHAALHFARLGFHVIASGRDVRALETLRKDAEGRLDTLRLDVTDATSIQAAVTQVDELTGGRGIDVLVNNAGYGMSAPVMETSDADLRAQYETNVFGLMNVTRAFLPKMVARRSGRILNVSSMGGRITLPLFGAYNSSKYAVESLSDAMRIELRPFGVDVVLIEPGPIRSQFSARSLESALSHKSEASPYRAIYARAEKLKQQADAQSYGPEHTSRAMERAVTARRPRARYVAPRRLAILLWLAARLPTRLVDFVMRKAIGLTPKALGA